jgi:hypothetical protein
MTLIKGENLTEKQKDEVLRAFIYRWTTGNHQRESVYMNLSKPTMPLQSDTEWLKNHAFWFINNGSRLARNRRFAEAA